MQISVLLLAIAFLSGCASSPTDSRVTFSKPGTGEMNEVPRESLIGTWYGSQPTKDGTIKEWISRRMPDGRFQAHFLERKDGRVINESSEVGEWGLTYNLEVIVTRGWLADGHFRPAPPASYFWDVYRIEQIDQHGMTYVHQGTGHRYQVRRVADDFDFRKEPNQPPDPTAATGRG